MFPKYKIRSFSTCLCILINTEKSSTNQAKFKYFERQPREIYRENNSIQRDSDKYLFRRTKFG